MDSPYVSRSTINKARLWKSNRPVLRWLDIELTERCNNNCIHCYINLPPDDSNAMKMELSGNELKRILKEAASLGCLKVRFTGGEPFLRKDFEELYVFSRRLGLKVAVFTNATLLTEKLAAVFSRFPPMEKIEVSVYGMKKSSYEFVTRVPGSYEAAKKGIGILLDKKIPFAVKNTLTPFNKKEVSRFDNWAKSIQGGEGVPYNIFFNLHCRRDERKNRFIRKFRVSPTEGVKFLMRDKKAYSKAILNFCSRFIGPPGDRLFSCGSGKGIGCVDAYGKFQPCMLLRHPDCVYDLKGGSLKDALENFFPRLREAKAMKSDYLNRCAECFLKDLCEQCPGVSWMEHGVLDRPVEYFCNIAHTQARAIGLLNPGEMGWEVSGWRERISKCVKKGGRDYENKY
ncbi:MAG: radical SAM protein [Candidatus Omnitrophota bacterium]